MPAPSHPPRYPKLAAKLAELDMSRQALARLVPTTAPYVSHIIRGHDNPSDAIKARIAEILDEPVEILFATRDELEDVRS